MTKEERKNVLKDPNEEAINRLVELDEIHLQIHCAVESVRQIWVAMTHSGNMPCEDDYDALYGIYSYLSEYEKRLSEWKDNYWKYGR